MSVDLQVPDVEHVGRHRIELEHPSVGFRIPGETTGAHLPVGAVMLDDRGCAVREAGCKEIRGPGDAGRVVVDFELAA